MSNLKWADVAHYYLKSGIDRRYSTEKETMGVEIPILRALEDMAEGEARGFFAIYRSMGWDNWKPNRLYANCKAFVVSYCKHLRMYPSEIVWLISKGFDVFGLIESNQAIRKGVENGL